MIGTMAALRFHNFKIQLSFKKGYKEKILGVWSPLELQPQLNNTIRALQKM